MALYAGKYHVPVLVTHYVAGKSTFKSRTIRFNAPLLDMHMACHKQQLQTQFLQTWISTKYYASSTLANKVIPVISLCIFSPPLPCPFIAESNS